VRHVIPPGSPERPSTRSALGRYSDSPRLSGNTVSHPVTRFMGASNEYSARSWMVATTSEAKTGRSRRLGDHHARPVFSTLPGSMSTSRGTSERRSISSTATASPPAGGGETALAHHRPVRDQRDIAPLSARRRPNRSAPGSDPPRRPPSQSGTAGSVRGRSQDPGPRPRRAAALGVVGTGRYHHLQAGSVGVDRPRPTRNGARRPRSPRRRGCESPAEP
jgi:hypothetical protein